MRRSTLFSLALLCFVSMALPASAAVCGTSTVTTLFAGQTIDAGTVTVSNDGTNLYVAYSTKNGWLLTETHLAIATSLAGIPQTKNGNPKVGNFAYQRSYHPAVGSDVYVLPLDQLAVSLHLDRFTCGSSQLYIAAHAVVVQLGSGGDVSSRETGWGYGAGFPGANWSTYFTHTIQCCPPPACLQPGSFRTQTQGGWGATCQGNNPGCYRDAHFASCFSSGLVVGDSAGFTATFNSSGAIEAFLPQGGTPDAFMQDHVDPSSTEAGVLAGQVVALTLNVGFDLCDASFGASPVNLRDLVVHDATSPCNTLTVTRILREANNALAGLPSLFTPAQANDCVTRINENFVDGTQAGSYLCQPEPE